MAARKLQQEVDKCFKKVAEGVAEFEGIYEKIEQSNNPAQKEKLEDNLKREIKKLQRLRDQIKTWAASNDIKDKTPLLEQRRLIETQMERFKAVEKAMKTKAYSKEGLSAAAKLDPKEQAKMEASEFLSGMVDELEQQIEAFEAESEALGATMKKGKSQSAKADRMAEIERIIEKHKWHQGRLELIRRSLENGGVETEQVTDLEETIRYYVTDGANSDYIEDDQMYDDLSLQEDEDNFGMPQENDKLSSQDAQSIQDDTAGDDTIGARPPPIAAVATKAPRAATTAAAGSDAVAPSGGGRRPSAQLKSPLPTLATLHTPQLPTISNGTGAALDKAGLNSTAMKPAALPMRPAGETLKYASAAAAAAASDRNNVGIAPLPPPIGASPALEKVGISPLPPSGVQSKVGAVSSPNVTAALPHHEREKERGAPLEVGSAKPSSLSVPAKAEPSKEKSSRAAGKAPMLPEQPPAAVSKAAAATAPPPQTNGVSSYASSSSHPVHRNLEGTDNGSSSALGGEEESIYHLPESLRELVEAFETNKRRQTPPTAAPSLRMLAASQAAAPDAADAEVPRFYRPDARFPSSSQFPQEPLPIFEDPRLYRRVDSDTLFYVFYYKQGTYQQYLAAKALKHGSWRFHKQYQTWFQRHEEPRSIAEDYEQGTYRFFDYESTWMNRRKADFKFAYKFLEDEV